MPRVAIISDTHIPSRERAVPDWIGDELERADHAIHAGDFDSQRAYDRIEALANGNLTAVRENTDPPTLEVSHADTLEVGGVTFAVTHGSGSSSGWARRVVETTRAKAATAEPVAVAGHTHEVVDTTVEGVRVLNPGSATGAAPADRATMYVATVTDGTLAVEVRTE